MRYLGGKSRLAPAIHELIVSKAPRATNVTDLFAGSGALSSYMKQQGFAVTTNDVLYFSYALARGSLALNRVPDFRKLSSYLGESPVAYLNTAPLPTPDASQFVRLNYSPDSTPPRMYLTETNSLRIDFVRQTLNDWRQQSLVTESEYFYLLAALLAAVPRVSNITGTYGAFLKYWDARATESISLDLHDVYDNKQRNRSYNSDAEELLKRISGEVLYLDPPYNSRQYLPNYHVLETIARYDNPVVAGVTGQRQGQQTRSDFCSKVTAEAALRGVLEAAQFEHIVLSYNNEGVIAPARLEEVLRDFAAPGTYELRTIPYRRYKNKIPNHTAGLQEHLYYIQKADA